MVASISQQSMSLEHDSNVTNFITNISREFPSPGERNGSK